MFLFVMKKVLLLLVAIFPVLASAQSAKFRYMPQQPSASTMVNGSKIKIMAFKGTEAGQQAPVNGSTLRTASTNHGVLAGYSTYDLQTNAGVARRHFVHDAVNNQNITTVWTMSNSSNPWNDRGTGYNYFAGGTSGVYGAAPTGRIETQRTGWPCIAKLTDGSELVVSHDPAQGSERLRFYKNTTAGSPTFTEMPTTISSSRAIWPRMAASGSNIYVVNNHQDTGYTHPTSQVKIPVFFSRSTDGGATWADDHIQLPGYDTTRYINGGGDTYAIDAKDNFVAVVLGGYFDDVALWKSSDFGATWTKTLIDSFPLAGFYNMNNRTSDVYLNNDPATPGQDGIPDTLFFNDGSVDVLIDDNNVVHVFYGLSRGVKPAVSADSAFFFPATNGVVHWTESNPTSLTVIGGAEDCDGDGFLNIVEHTTEGSATGLGGRYRLSGLASMPSAGIDAAGNLFCIYTAINELDTTDGTFNGMFQNYRDVHVVFSTDGGATWSTAQNITNDQAGTFNANEEVFASMARNVGSSIEITYQWDTEPGTELQNGDDPGLNEIRAVSVPTTSIINNAFEGACGKSSAMTALSGPFGAVAPISVASMVDEFNTVVYPNPSSGVVNFNFELSAAGKTEIVISNLMGQAVYTVAAGEFTAGQHEVRAELGSLSSGLYLYTVRSEGKSFSGRLMIQK
jgi:hypothetical protein